VSLVRPAARSSRRRAATGGGILPDDQHRPIEGAVSVSAVATPASRTGRSRKPAAKPASAPPVLVRQIRNGIVEAEHRGHIVEVDASGRVLRLLGDPDHLVTLRSTVKPIGAAAIVAAGGVEAFDLSTEELAIMGSSHSGEDLHVRTIQAMFRRVGLSQTLLACGAEGMPLDQLTAARLARDGERPSPIRHMCSGQHSVFLLLAKLADWSLEDYWMDEHPAQAAYREVVAQAFGTTTDALVMATDGCGVATYAFPLREVARAYALLADPSAVPTSDPRSGLAPSLTRVRDALLAHPEIIGGTRDRLDTALMKALPGRIVSKGGMEALRGLAILEGPRANGTVVGAAGMALKIEDGDGYERGTWAATVEAAEQAEILSGSALRSLARYHRPPTIDPHGRVAAEAVASFVLVPVGELA
jgi:L-asparaginase II